MKRNALLYCFICFFFALGAENRAVEPTLLIGGDYNYPPYEFINPQGQPDGYNVELSRLICKELGYKPVFRLGKWALVRQWLDDGKIDLIQGMAYSIKRSRDTDFSNAHTHTWRGIFVQRKSGIRDLKNNPNLLVVLQEDDIAEDYLKQIGFEGKISRLSNQEEMLRLLNDGVYNAAVANYMAAKYIIKRDGLNKIKALPQRIYQRDYCYASHDPALIAKVNDALERLDTSGKLHELHNKWFESLDSNEEDAEVRGVIPDWVFWALLAVLVAASGLLGIYYLRLKRWQKKLTGCKQEEERRKYYSEIYQDFFAQGRVVIYRLDYQNRQLSGISKSVSEWGYTAQELLNFEGEIIFLEDLPRYKAFYDSLSDKAYSVGQYRIVTKSGDLRWVLDCARLYLKETGEGMIMVGYLIDITEQKAREVQLYSAREKAESEAHAKNHFCAVMSHEIRNAVNGSFGFIQVLRQMNKDPDIEELLANLYSAETGMIKMLDNVLEYSKIDAGKLNLILSSFDLKRLIADTVKSTELQKLKEEVKVEYKFSEELPQVIFGDQLRLKQIFTNLLQNALKFTESGKIEIAAEPYTRNENEIRILFKVEDTGIGIQHHRLKEIFDKYNQAEDDIALKYGGSGLGLAIVKKLVELMHGFIWVESEPEKGTCFYFIIPFTLRAAGKEDEMVVQVPKIIKRIPLKGRVLLAENQKLIQLFASKLLQMWGLTVDIAKDGAEAIKMHKEKLYDLILVNGQLPVFDGLELCYQVRQLERVLNRKTPIIACIENYSEEDVLNLTSSGIDDCIANLVDIDVLYETLIKYLQKAE